jgi:mannose-6-phosphate isomerase-like protein (cupin superfamily)
VSVAVPNDTIHPGERMIRAGFVFEYPVSRTRTVVLESDHETRGMGWLLEVTRHSAAGPDLGEHLHRTWTETFEIVEGRARYGLDGREGVIGAGESFVVPPGSLHVHPWNAAEGKLVFRQRTRFAAPSPAAVQDILGIFATRTGMERDGTAPSSGFGRAMQQAVTLRTAIRHGNYMGVPSAGAQRAVAATLGVLAAALGYRAVRSEYTAG